MPRIKSPYCAPLAKTNARSAATRSTLRVAGQPSKHGPPTTFGTGASHGSSSPQKSASCFRYVDHSTSDSANTPLNTKVDTHGSEEENSQTMSNNPARRREFGRKSRTGCMICRKRHLKCIERHPICERCEKGARECLYKDELAAEASATCRLNHVDSSNQGSHSSLNEDDGGSSHEITSVITSAQANDLARTDRLSLPSANGFGNTMLAGSTVINSVHTQTLVNLSDIRSHMPQNFSCLPPELRPYLEYFLDNITHYHYGVHRDDDNFFGATLVNFALCSEALLYAVTAFAAYHSTLGSKNGELPRFLELYSKGIALLRQLINNGGKHETATLLAILQLGTIEEYLGDGLTLAKHRKAALDVLSQQFTSNSIVLSSLNRTIFSWCQRLDLVGGPILGLPTGFSHDWFVSLESYCQVRLLSEPDNLSLLNERAENRLRLICYNISLASAQRPINHQDGELSGAHYDTISKALREWKDDLENALSHASDSDGMIESALCNTDLFPAKLLLCEWHFAVIIHLQEATQVTQNNIEISLGNVSEHISAIIQMFNAIEQRPSAPKGVLIMLQPYLTIASTHLQITTDSIMWLRNKLALLERSGYIFPVWMRRRVAKQLQDETIERWWLPDGRGFTTILQEVRAFAEERHAAITSMQSRQVRVHYEQGLNEGGFDYSHTRARYLVVSRRVV